MTMSPMTKRITLLPLMIVALVVALASAAGAQQVHLQVAIADPGKTPIDSLQEMVAEFERLHPNIKIEILNDYANSFDLLATHMAGGVASGHPSLLQ